MEKLNLGFIIISFLAALPGANFAFNVVSTWFVWWFPEKWVLDLVILSFPIMVFFIVLLFNFAKRFSKNRKSTIFTSMALVLTQFFFYAFFVSRGFSIF